MARGQKPESTSSRIAANDKISNEKHVALGVFVFILIKEGMLLS